MSEDVRSTETDCSLLGVEAGQSLAKAGGLAYVHCLPPASSIALRVDVVSRLVFKRSVDRVHPIGVLAQSAT